MHGLDLPLLLSLRLDSKLTQAMKTRAGVRAEAIAPSPGIGPIKGMRNILRPRPDQLFSANGLVAEAANGNDAPLRNLMRDLAVRLQRIEAWPDTLAPQDPLVEDFENPGLPSGYTYLLQLVAHDLVNSAVSLAGTGSGGLGFANTRVAPLSLDTIYGGGPSVCPHAYEFDREHRQYPGSVPRSRLRLGRSRNRKGSTARCPFRDIARAIPAATKDSGLSPHEQLDLSSPAGPSDGPSRRPWWTEALLADPRNDDHALLSQLTVLFHVLHNDLIDMLNPRPVGPAHVLREFLCTRFVVTLIYRAILVKDVLARILHPDIYRHYVTQRKPLLDEQPQCGGPRDDIPREFSHGAFRFGHVMVRGAYRVNSDEPLDFIQALGQSSLRNPNNVPVSSRWLVDWSLFFDVGSSRPNLSVRIGPGFSPVLMNSGLFPALSDTDTPGLANRDMLSAAYAELWSVPPLVSELRSHPEISAVLPSFEVWKQPLRNWLSRYGTLSSENVEILVADPPLPFFVMFEAAHPVANGVPTNRDGGRHLGPLGSIIVAETILGALKRNAIGFEADGRTLREQISSVCNAFFDEPAALDAVPEIANMPDLLRFMRDRGVIELPAAG